MYNSLHGLHFPASNNTIFAQPIRIPQAFHLFLIRSYITSPLLLLILQRKQTKSVEFYKYSHTPPVYTYNFK